MIGKWNKIVPKIDIIDGGAGGGGVAGGYQSGYKYGYGGLGHQKGH